MILWWLKRFFASYRFEGVVPVAQTISDEMLLEQPSPSVVDLEPYVHPFEIPGSNRYVIQFSGDPGATKLSAKWEREHMVLLKKLPGEWNDGRARMYCHRMVAPAFAEALRRCELYGVLEHVYKIGCFNYRTMRSNSAKLSYHSFGAAFDLNPRDNLARKYDRGTAPAPWSAEWLEIWPDGLPPDVVRAFKEAGFSWGGDWATFVDPMHFELVGTPKAHIVPAEC